MAFRMASYSSDGDNKSYIPMPKRCSNIKFCSNPLTSTKYSDQSISRRRAPKGKREDCQCQTVTLAKQIKIKAESWFLEFLEKASDMGWSNANSSDDVVENSADSNQKQNRISSTQLLLSKIIQWVEQSTPGSNRDGWALDPGMAEVLKKLNLRLNSFRGLNALYELNCL